MKFGIELLLKGNLKVSYTQILQGPNEAYADFLARLEVAISHSVIGEEARNDEPIWTEQWPLTKKKGESTKRRQWRPTPVLLPGKSHGRRSLVGCNP